MTSFHAHFYFRNQQAFQRLLDRSNDAHILRTSSGSSKTPPRATALTTESQDRDVNARDWLGRTVLHLACAATDPSALNFVRMLLGPNVKIDVNLRDVENQWTALHRALYAGNLPAAVLLLQRADVDLYLKDSEGLTAFDLYNTTVEGTRPSSNHGDVYIGQVYTWSTNKSPPVDGDDGTTPELVFVPSNKRLRDNLSSEQGSRPCLDVDSRFLPVSVMSVQMSRLHIAIKTSERPGNVRLLGMGTAGRAAISHPSLTNLPFTTLSVKSLALGPSHTIILTASGDVLTWGSNRFAQLGYAVEKTAKGGRDGQQPAPHIQSTPRRVSGPLKGLVVIGVAVCKVASACWTKHEVFTWGTNFGQLGYDSSMQQVQILPHKVTKVPPYAPSIDDVVITTHAMVWLLDTKDIWVVVDNRGQRLTLPTHTFPSGMQTWFSSYPLAPRNSDVAKIACVEMEQGNCSQFAAVGMYGQVWTWVLGADKDHEREHGAKIKVQSLWTLHKRRISVKDVALGADGSMVICDDAGHVFVRLKKGGNAISKFQRVPHLQRVVSVCAGGSGVHGAIKLESPPKIFRTRDRGIGEDLARVMPWAVDMPSGELSSLEGNAERDQSSPGDSPQDATSVEGDIEGIKSLLKFLSNDSKPGLNSADYPNLRAHYAGRVDVLVQVDSSPMFPAHRTILAARCSVLNNCLAGLVPTLRHSSISIDSVTTNELRNPQSQFHSRLIFSGCCVISVLILLTYLYTDEVLSIWDTRVVSELDAQILGILRIEPATVKIELQGLAILLDLPLLAQALESPAKRNGNPSITTDMMRLFEDTQAWSAGSENSVLAPDVMLLLADRVVLCHSIILCARSQFFASLFGDELWTAKRWAHDGTIHVDLKHMQWRVMEFVTRFLYCGDGEEMFKILEFLESGEELLEFMFEVVAAANELLIDQLVLVCSAVILRHSNIYNASYVFAEAIHYHIPPLIQSISEYMSVNMETLLESGMLDLLSPDLVAHLGAFIRQKQAVKSPYVTSNKFVEQALKKHEDWLALQDIPEPVMKSGRILSQRPRRSSGPIAAGPSCDDVFVMDELNAEPNRHEIPEDRASIGLGWKHIQNAPRIDMKAIMAEAQGSRSHASRTTGLTPPHRGTRLLGVTIATDTDATSTARPISRAKPAREERGKSSSYESAGPSSALSKASRSPWRIPGTESETTPPNAHPMSSSAFYGTVSRQEKQSDDSWRSLKTAVQSPSSSISKTQSLPLRRPPSQLSIGPTFAPSRQAPAGAIPSSARHVLGSRAWGLCPVEPTIVEPSSSDTLISFVAIQQLQIDQSTLPGTDRRSLREIQEEEEARRVEEGFLQWWSAEEERIRIETQHSQQPRGSRGQRSKGQHPSRSIPRA